LLGDVVHGKAEETVRGGDADPQAGEVRVFQQGGEQEYAGFPAFAALLAFAAVGQVQGGDELARMSVVALEPFRAQGEHAGNPALAGFGRPGQREPGVARVVPAEVTP